MRKCGLPCWVTFEELTLARCFAIMGPGVFQYEISTIE